MNRFLVFFASLCCLCFTAIAKGPNTNYRNALIFAYSPVNSVFEDENIKLEIYNEMLYATNKTKKTIFIDLSQSFLVCNGSSYPLLSKAQDEKNSSKTKISTSIDDFISIAPNTGAKQNETFICNMSKRLYGRYSSSESPSESFSEYDSRLLNLIGELVEESIQADPKGKEYLGTVCRHLTEEESINNIGASIAYAFSKRAEDWTSIQISTWVCDVIFTPYFVEMPKELSKKEKSGFGVKESAPAIIHVRAASPFEFDSDKSPVIVADWQGDFKKGTFNLNSTRISKVKKAGFLANMFTLGAASLLEPLTETTYKSIIQFDGENQDWGKMKYVNSINETKQTN